MERGLQSLEQAQRLSPRDPETPNRLMNLGLAELGLGHFDAAVAELQKAIDSGALTADLAPQGGPSVTTRDAGAAVLAAL